ncbi:carbohydrate-binding family 9-like protein [Paenibacillus sp. YAF4_2]|uniref:carbohydrate-binding family 9-like protein n=1 Tax=Paenibacillus sp. YAF4_2 TaxID=3233085 RepID=UPI003F983443
MNKSYEIAYDEAASDFDNAHWQQLTPVSVAHQQWLILDHPPETEVRTVYDANALHLQFRVFEIAPLIRHRYNGAPVYEDSCVEFFLQPLPLQDERYFNFELNAAGVLLLEIGERGKVRKRITAEDYGQFGIRSEVGLWDPVSSRMYWELHLSVPFAFVQDWFPSFRAIPGVVMKGNFYKCGDLTPEPHYVSWSPVKSATPDFHRSSSFGMLMLGSRN